MMETIWKALGVFLGLIFFEFCEGFPVNLENSGTDSHTQLLTGLVAVLLTVCCIVALAGCLCCTRRNGFQEFRDSPVVVSVASNLDHGHVNPIGNGEFTIFTPLSPPHYNNNIFLANQEIVTRAEEDYKYGDIDIRSWFNGTEKDFPRTKLKYIRELGKGWFGRVVEGAAQEEDKAQNWRQVVVRILEANASNKDRVLFLHDANIYRCGAHPNILSLFGRSLDTIPMLLMQEYCAKNDLKRNLRDNMSKREFFLSSELPLRWCWQLSSAVKHLHSYNIAHPDLAARNCLLTDDLHLKLGDYGLGVFSYPEDYYKGAPGLSVRWCSPESITYTSTTIQPNKVTLESNIWSLGVTMWEIFECGEQPYSCLNDDEVITQVLGAPNLRLSRPNYCVLYTDYIFRLMQMCWSTFELRPAISQVELMLEDLMQVYKNTNIGQGGAFMHNFDDCWETFKPDTIVKTDNHITEDCGDANESNAHHTTGASEMPKELCGSLNNLLEDSCTVQNNEMESWLENLASNPEDLSYVRGLHDAMNDLDNAIALENISSSDSSHRPSPAPNANRKHKLEFKLGPLNKSKTPSPPGNDSFTDSLLFARRTSSESETEEENWKKKIERGAYSEKVRQKSRSVADLMVLTHIDCSESDSETPLPSLENRVTYKNVRLTQNLDSAALMYGSEGNLLSVKETFQEELRKLKEERKDSLLFVPASHKETESLPDSSSSRNEYPSSSDDLTLSTENLLTGSSNTRLFEDLHNPSEITPGNQVYNVFNVSIESKYSPIHNSNVKLNKIINFNNDKYHSFPDKVEEYGLLKDGSSEDIILLNNDDLVLRETYFNSKSCNHEKKDLESQHTEKEPMKYVDSLECNQINITDEEKQHIRAKHSEKTVESLTEESAPLKKVEHTNDLKISPQKAVIIESIAKLSTKEPKVNLNTIEDNRKVECLNDAHNQVESKKKSLYESHEHFILAGKANHGYTELHVEDLSENKVHEPPERSITEAEVTLQKFSEAESTNSLEQNGLDEKDVNVSSKLEEELNGKLETESQIIRCVGAFAQHGTDKKDKEHTDEHSTQFNIGQNSENHSEPSFLHNEINETKNMLGDLNVEDSEKVDQSLKLDSKEEHALIDEYSNLDMALNETARSVSVFIEKERADIFKPYLDGLETVDESSRNLEEHTFNDDYNSKENISINNQNQENNGDLDKVLNAAVDEYKPALNNLEIAGESLYLEAKKHTFNMDINAKENNCGSKKVLEETINVPVTSQEPRLNNLKIVDEFLNVELNKDMDSDSKANILEAIQEQAKYTDLGKVLDTTINVSVIVQEDPLNSFEILDEAPSLQEYEEKTFIIDTAVKENISEAPQLQETINVSTAVQEAEMRNQEIVYESPNIQLNNTYACVIDDNPNENLSEKNQIQDTNFTLVELLDERTRVPTNVQEGAETYKPQSNNLETINETFDLQSHNQHTFIIDDNCEENFSEVNQNICDLGTVLNKTMSLSEIQKEEVAKDILEYASNDAPKPNEISLEPTDDAATPQHEAIIALNTMVDNSRQNVVMQSAKITNGNDLVKCNKDDDEDIVNKVEVQIQEVKDVESETEYTDVQTEINLKDINSDSFKSITSEIDSINLDSFDVSTEDSKYVETRDSIATASNEKDQFSDISINSIQNSNDFEDFDSVALNKLATNLTSTPFIKRRPENAVVFGSCADYTLDLFSGLKSSLDGECTEEEELQFSSNFMQTDEKVLEDVCTEYLPTQPTNCLNYSLETWDNFLDKALDRQEDKNFFDNFSSEPPSLAFVPEDGNCAVNKTEQILESHFDDTFDVTKGQNQTFVKDEAEVKNDELVEFNKDETFDVNDNATFVKDDHAEASVNEKSDSGEWESGGGWFLHPQSSQEELTGQITIPAENETETYVGFSMDDEIMSAIRNELLMKLPHAQRVSNDRAPEQEETDTGDKVEVFIKYKAPLSPILEESISECNSCLYTPQPSREDTDDESDWTEPAMQTNDEDIPLDTETHSPLILGSPAKGPNHRHTPSQDSCCSNDTLFNLEELAANEQDKPCTTKESDDYDSRFYSENNDEEFIHESVSNEGSESNILVTNEYKSESNAVEPCQCDDDYSEETKVGEEDIIAVEQLTKIVIQEEKGAVTYEYISDFLANERSNAAAFKTCTDSTRDGGGTTLNCCNKNAAPLPSPEDRHWKELQAPFLTYNSTTDKAQPEIDLDPDNTKPGDLFLDRTSTSVYPDNVEKERKVQNYVNIDCCRSLDDYENLKNSGIASEYENVKDAEIMYENSRPLYENSNSPAVYMMDEDSVEPAYVDKIETVYEPEFSNVYGALTDIRFTGPCDIQLMSTSFSESNELPDEQDWDSGSDTRSSSSGEFIWKEGEHEESVKALRAAPQLSNTDENTVNPMDGINEDEVTESSGSEEEGESPEFVPSAWDKYATPSKSALRSPEKTLGKPDKKPKGVWFKKQKYHCVYEYPKEPESPILHSYDLWKPAVDYATLADWNLDEDAFLPQTNESEEYDIQKKFMPECMDNIQTTSLGGDFFISSSTRPFDSMSGLSSEFFPGRCDNWCELINDNITPDSGIDDLTPGSLTDNNEYPTLPHPLRDVQPLKYLAAFVVNRSNSNKSKALGGLRHTRNKLKLDLPPSPSAFTAGKVFAVEPQEDLVVRTMPTFTTFGKSRFLVQHVDTPTDEKSENFKNVSFEALPHKPITKQIIKDDCTMDKEKQNVEVVRGEASLLDSADEDSGIESCMLDRKKVENDVE